MKSNLGKQVEANTSLISQQQVLRTKYDDAIKTNQDVQQRQKDLQTEITQLHEAILSLCPSKQLPAVESITRPLVTPAAAKMIPSPAPTLSSTPPPQLITSRIMSVPTAAALKQGVGFPLNSLRKDDTGRILSTQRISNDDLMNVCGICKKCTDQHLLAKCDTCHLHYHLGCLNPPLSRQPKRSKQYAWQCSECDKSDDSATENVIIPKGPRKSRVRYNKDGPIITDPLRDSFGSEKSMALSKKSDESHHRTTFNGSDMDFQAEVEPVNAAIDFEAAIDTVPTTSTPIAHIKVPPKVTLKRGRKPKPKPSLESSAAIDLSSQERPKKKAKAMKTDVADSSPVVPALPVSPQKMPIPRRNSLLDLSAVAAEKRKKKQKLKQTVSLLVKPKKKPAKAASKETFNNHDNSQPQQLIVGNMEAIAPPSLDLEKLSPPIGPKIPKKGRPRKEKPEKPSITQIFSKLQEEREVTLFQGDHPQPHQLLEPNPEVTLFNRNASFALAQIRSFADIPTSIPYPAIELPKAVEEPVEIPFIPAFKPEPVPTNGVVVNGEGTASSGSGHHKHKKQKKHKRRHSNSPSSGDRQSPTKKPKKRKKDRSYTIDEAGTNPFEFERSPEQPRIKMKFFAKHVQAGDDKKIMWSLPDADAAETTPLHGAPGEVYSNGGQQLGTVMPNGNGHGKVVKSIKKRKKPPQRAALKNAHDIDTPGKKGISAPVIAPSHFTVAASSAPNSPAAAVAVINKSLPLPNEICDVCHKKEDIQNLVK